MQHHKRNKRNTHRNVTGLVVLLTTLSSLLLVNMTALAATEEENVLRADEIATLFRAARAVISKNQSHINDPNVGDKGLSGDVLVEQAKVNYEKAKGRAFAMADPGSETGRAQQVFFDSLSAVMDEAAALINEKGKGFKGFLPAVFAKAVADEFSRGMNGEMSIKLTAPKAYVRNRRNRPDAWEASVIQDQFLAAGYETGKPFWETTSYNGQPTFRYIIPEYYGESCLSCHGGPKGERDITGGLKEGGVLGELGGAISLTIAAN